MFRLSRRKRLRISFFLSLLLLLNSCTLNDSGPDLGKAFVAPASVNLRSQLNQKNSTVAVLKHGEQVTIVDVRRRFVRVRTSKGAEGWLDSLDLLSPDEMKRIQDERARALKLPSEGTATAYEALNIHLNPNRKSPSFTQIPEGGAVQVLARRLEPKTAGVERPSSLVIEKPQPARKPKKDRVAKLSTRLPPPPPPPKPPPNWENLLGGEHPDEEDRAEAAVLSRSKPPQKEEPKKPEILEYWTLVRTPNKQVGWVLSRNLMMSIPDEVAQYAGGRHITSFFDLGLVNDDEKGPKHNWLWTTSGISMPYDFDAWRVFLWNRRRHRYETSYRMRDLEGYFPVHVEPADPSSKTRNFEIITKDDDGKFRRRTYLFDGTLVHLAGTESYQPGQTPGDGAEPKSLQAQLSKGNWFTRKWSEWKRRLGGS